MHSKGEGEKALSIQLGKFDRLAGEYSRYRPSYAPSVASAVLGLLERNPAEIDAADVGAGTGIWTRMLAQRGLRSVVAVEPSDAMRAAGVRDQAAFPIRWLAGQAEQTGLPSCSVDLLTMASSFHWADFDAAVGEFHRVLRSDGWFCAVWNPRLIEVNPLFVEIEGYLDDLCPGLERRSSGRSSFTETLTERLWGCGRFDDVVTLEGRHVAMQSREHYLGAWRSVNDVQAQLGPERFAAFLRRIEERLEGIDTLEVTYLTRAWAARRKG